MATSNPVILGGASLVGKMTLDFKKKRWTCKRYYTIKKNKKKTRKKQAEIKQLKIEMWFSFLLCFVLKKTSYKRSNKIPKNRSRFEFFLKNPLEKNKKKTKLVFLCCLLKQALRTSGKPWPRFIQFLLNKSILRSWI